jgi:hypothetical protein
MRDAAHCEESVGFAFCEPSYHQVDGFRTHERRRGLQRHHDVDGPSGPFQELYRVENDGVDGHRVRGEPPWSANNACSATRRDYSDFVIVCANDDFVDV